MMGISPAAELVDGGAAGAPDAGATDGGVPTGSGGGGFAPDTTAGTPGATAGSWADAWGVATKNSARTNTARTGNAGKHDKAGWKIPLKVRPEFRR